MNFAETQYLIATILGVPALILFFVWVRHQKQVALERFAGSELLDQLTRSASPARQRLRNALVLLGLALVGVALARPRWGQTEELVKRRGIEVLIAVDVSKSMLAEDLKPSRISRARREIQDLLGLLEGNRVGLIAFAGDAFVHCPPTTDLDACGLFVESIDIGLIQRGGTHIGDAIRKAAKVFEESPAAQKALILITDGEDHDTDPVTAAKDITKVGARIYAIGIGTPDGSLIPVTDEKGNVVYLKDRQGQVVKSRLDETSLQKIALETGGAYHRATGAGLELEEILKRVESLEKSELESEKLQRYQHRYQVFLLGAFLLLLVEPMISDRRRRAAIRPAASAAEIAA
jgi:Ca-activated chloride channel family protein